MADNPAEAEAAPAGGGGGGKKTLIIVIVAVVLLVVLGAAGFFVVKPMMSGGGEQGARKAEEAAPEPTASLGNIVELDPFIVNLSGGGGRYLKTTVVFHVSTKDVIEEITNRKPQIKDAVLTVLSSKTPDEILSIQGKYDLKVEIMKRVNSFLVTGVARELYFVEFVVQ